jgi:hypothetical protein
VVTDEIYEHLVYDGARFASMPVEVPELADTCVVLNGVAKTYAMTGWRVGWLIGPKDIVKAATNLQSHATSNVANVSQRAAIAALEGDLSAVEMMRTAFDRRRRTMVGMLNEIDGVVCPVPTGGLYVYPSVHGVLGRTIRGRTPATSGAAGRADPRGGRGRGGAGRGLRARAATCGCRTPSATTTWPRAWPHPGAAEGLTLRPGVHRPVDPGTAGRSARTGPRAAPGWEA